jgi:hypothetical protein
MFKIMNWEKEVVATQSQQPLFSVRNDLEEIEMNKKI